MTSTAERADFDAVFDRLKGILEPYARPVHVSADAPGVYGVDMAPEAERNPTTWFGAVRKGKRYVSYYLMPVYVEPSLLGGVSPELRRRMQGKSCFNFTTVDDRVPRELEDLTGTGYARTVGGPGWGVSRREEQGMALRRAMDRSKR